VDLALEEVHADIVERLGDAEALGDVLGAEEDGMGGGTCH
jgi:hypothetical protein